MIFRVCLIIAISFNIAMTDDSKTVKLLGVISIALMSISFLGR